MDVHSGGSLELFIEPAAFISEVGNGLREHMLANLDFHPRRFLGLLLELLGLFAQCFDAILEFLGLFAELYDSGLLFGEEIAWPAGEGL